MSSPRGPKDHSPSRRGFLRRVGAAGSTLAVTPWLGACSGDSDIAFGGEVDTGGGSAVETPAEPAPETTDVKVRFEHGVASGDPLPDAVVLWTRVTPAESTTLPVGGRYVVARDEALSDIASEGGFLTDAGRDYTVKIDRDGLESGRTYYYRFEANGARSPVGCTRTAPIGPVDHARIAFTSCSQYTDGYFNVYAAMAARADIDLVLHLGDYIYEYGSTGIDGRDHEPATEIVSLADYRLRHAQYKRDPDLQALHAAHPMVVVWDDHESTNDSWADGAENHQPDTEGAWAARKARSIQAYYEWLPIRAVEPDRPERIYRRFAWGDLVHLIMLDTRLVGRDQQASSPVDAATIGDERRTMLGFEQEAWLNGELARSTAQWKLLGQQVMFMPLRLGLPRLLDLNLLPALDEKLTLLTNGGVAINVDQWDGYPAARDRIIDQLRIQGLDDVVVLAGDIHTSWAQDVTEDPNNPAVYNPLTGEGSRAVEFVCPSVTSSGLPELQPARDSIRVLNPHMKYVDLENHGYVLLDITSERLQGEFWYVNTIAERDAGERFATSFVTQSRANRLSEQRTASTGEQATATQPPNIGPEPVAGDVRAAPNQAVADGAILAPSVG
ncbi:alkaline phosphatase [Salinisphaera dokdonensis CL-ES53]|uniref:Alkaline phosphatase n=1 Tax=Salinisphaera dokdonensis CL-ES53 TaxID=1304272 RepID=A0ABV2B0J6_9GAMM